MPLAGLPRLFGVLGLEDVQTQLCEPVAHRHADGILVLDEEARGEVALAASHFVITLVVAAGLRNARRWSWWAALLLVAIGLFFLLPIAMGYFLGTGEGPLGGTRESLFVLSSFAVLVVLAVVLVAGRRALGIEKA